MWRAIFGLGLIGIMAAGQSAAAAVVTLCSSPLDGHCALHDGHIEYLNDCGRDAGADRFCMHIGKRARDLRDVREPEAASAMPVIFGVVWRPASTLVAVHGQNWATADEDGYYYMVRSDGSDTVFLLPVEVVEPR